MNDTIQIVTVDAANVAEQGFFCYKSKPKSEGYRRKLNWLEQRFAEGMKIKILIENGRSVGFIEYIPGEYAWRSINANGYMVIHCLWVVGRGKGKGYGTRLLDACIKDAREQGMQGVAMVASSRVWLADKKLFLKSDFEVIDQAPPSFDLLVKNFTDAPTIPSFPTDWEARAARYPSGLTIFRSDQCPYIVDAAKIFTETAAELNIPAQVIEIKTAREVQELAPSAYGLFNVVYNGKLLSYHYLTEKQLLKRLDEFGEA